MDVVPTAIILPPFFLTALILSAASGETLSYPASAHGSISVFAAGDSAVVTLRGLKYSLESYRLSGFFPLGVSNSFTGAAASVTVSVPATASETVLPTATTAAPTLPAQCEQKYSSGELVGGALAVRR